MNRPLTITLLFLLSAALFIGCSSDDNKSPTGPTITAPSNLVATVLSASAVRLQWRDNSYTESGFRIERAPGGSDTFTRIFETSMDVQAYTDTGLTEGTTFRYRVLAFGVNSVSNPTDPVTVATFPNAPVGLVATQASGTEIDLVWTDASTAETAYQIERRASGTPVAQIMLPADSESYRDTDLAQNKTYTYKVRAMKDSVASVWSNDARATTRVYTPMAPTELVATPTSQFTVSLMWNINSDNELGFVIEKSLYDNVGFEIADSIRAQLYSSVVRDLSSRTTYYFRVYAYNDSGRSPYSNIATATTPAGPPVAPSNLTGSAPNYRRAIIQWTDNSDEEDGFRLERKLLTATRWDQRAELAPNETTFIDSAVTPGASFIYRVQAFNQYGTSGYSNELRVVIPSGSPTPPSGLDAVAVNARQVNVTWVDNSEDEVGFTLQRRNVGQANWAPIAELGENETAYTDLNVSPLMSYGYRVRAFNRINNNVLVSEFSNEDTVTTPDGVPNAPSNMILQPLAIDKIRVLWRDNSSNETDFLIERKGPDDQVFSLVGSVARNVAAYIDTGLAHTTMYAYRVKAMNGLGESEYSNIDSVRTLNPVVFYDGFETYEVNQPPRGGSWADTARGTSWIRVTNAMSMPAGGKSVQFHDPDIGGNFCALDLSAPSMSGGTVSFYVNLSNVGSFGIWGGDQAGYITFDVRFRQDGAIYARSGATFVSCGNYPIMRWVELKLSFSMTTHTYTLYLDNVAIGENLATQRNDHLDNRFIRFLAFSDAELPDAYVDEFKLDVRQVQQGPGLIPPVHPGNGDDRIENIDLNNW